jgi:hypothetical protein
MHMSFPSDLPSFNPDDTNRCVHSTHCCAVHGCKYGNDDVCPVANGNKLQNYPCETCSFVLDEYDEFVENTPNERIQEIIV